MQRINRQRAGLTSNSIYLKPKQYPIIPDYTYKSNGFYLSKSHGNTVYFTLEQARDLANCKEMVVKEPGFGAGLLDVLDCLKNMDIIASVLVKDIIVEYLGFVKRRRFGSGICYRLT